MPALRELQACIVAAILGGDQQQAARHVRGDGLDPEARLRIYRHHVFTTLTEVLERTFPVVCRLVDTRFFAYAADRYIREHPPTGPCLAEYGATFPAFLADFPPCRDHGYLPDVARLEWAVNVARLAGEAASIDVAQLATMRLEVFPRLVFRFDPSVSFVASSWPIDRIWRANQDDADGDGAVDLDAGGVHLQVRRIGEGVAIQAVSAPRHAFRRTLGEGVRLEEAASAALALDPSFDLTGEIRQLLDEQLPVAVALYSEQVPDAV